MLISASTLHAQILYWAGGSGNPLTAGGGIWDANTTVAWRDNSPTGSLVKWTQNRTAIFTGTAGGAVSANDSLSIDAIQIDASAGAFTFTTSSLVTIGGAGISNESTATQTINLNLGILTFTGNASAAAGSQGTKVKINGDGQIWFNSSSTAGAVELTNSGDVSFTENSSAGTSRIASTGQVSFVGTATAGAATITNDGALSFDEDARSGAAAITNRGQLSISGNAHLFGTASISNLTLGVIDLSGSTAAAGLTLGTLTNTADSTLNLGSTRLQVANLNLIDGNALSYNLGPAGTGLIEVTTSIIGNPTAEGTVVTINDTGGIYAGRIVSLLDWSAATTALGVDSTDFRLEPLPAGFTGTLRVQGTKLVLEVLPEPGTALLALLGALPLAALRRRQR